MKTLQILSCLLLFSTSVFSQDIFGKWVTIDDKTGEQKSIVDIYEKDGKVYGKITALINPKKKNSKCTECSGKNKNQPIVGMVIIEGLTQDGDVYNDGTILNPSNGKVYDCRLKLQDNPNRLQVRGYVAFFYKTQYWERHQ